MAKIINARIKMKRDTASNWESSNPVLYKGEIVIVDTSNGEVRGKIGDGVKTYTQLPFSDEIVRNLINSNKQAIDNHTKDTNVHVTTSEKDSWNSKAAGTHTHTKSQVGLSNVDNTADSQKSVKYATSAGSASTATTATKLGSMSVGSSTEPVYLNDGTPTACTYTLEKSVPANAIFTDTIYDHPSSHPASMISQDSTHRFVSDTDILAWNSKVSSEIATPSSNGLMSADDKSKLNSLGRVYTGTTTPSDSLGQDGDLYIFVKSQTYQTKIDALEEWKTSVLAGQSPVVIES